jgi:predicted AAA+ superfamily ATPase
MIEILKRIIIDYQKKTLPELTKRDLKLTFVKGMALGISGVRRGGKTYRTHQLAFELSENGTLDNICRIQFNDHRIINIPANQLHIIDDAYYSIYPEKREKEDVYFIFDEIHRIDGWENYILYLLETATHKIIVTGSTASLLRGNFASSLRGKLFPLELYPFSFNEYLRHHRIEPEFISSNGRSFLLNSLSGYLKSGGFPGVYDISEEIRDDLLRTYWDTMLLRDVIETHNDENIDAVLLRQFCDALISRVGCPMTVNKIAQNLKNSGFSFNQEKIYRYLKYVTDAYMVHTVEFFSESEKIRSKNYKKVYCIDWALAKAVSFGAGTDDTRLFENMIFLELKRRGKNVSYYKTREGFEVDFVATGKNKEIELIQVSFSIENASVENREMRSLVSAGKHLKADMLIIVTLNDEKTFEIDGSKIKVVPAWKWLLGKS